MLDEVQGPGAATSPRSSGLSTCTSEPLGPVCDHAAMSDEPVPESPGIGVDDLPALMRELFDQCVADARLTADPREAFGAFVDALWEQVAAAFELTRREWPAGAPAPWPALADAQRGRAEALLEGGEGEDELPG